MKITFIVTKLNLNGGGENHDVMMKARALQEMGHEINVATAFSNLNDMPAAMPFNILKEQAPRGGLLALQIFIVRVLKKYQAQTDVFYLVGSSFLFGGGWYRLFCGSSKPVVADLNGYADYIEGYYKKEPLYPIVYLPWRRNLRQKIKHVARIWLERSLGVFLINRLDAIVFMTKTIAHYYERAGVNKDKSAVIPSFMDIKSPKIQVLQNNPFVKFSKDAFHILCVGRFHVDKGIDLLIKAFSGYSCPNAILHLVGDGPEKIVLEEMVNKNGLDKKIKFYPWQKSDEVVAFYQHANLFVHPARLPEPMVRTVIEAMSFGLPLVVSNTSRESWLNEVAKVFTLGDTGDLRAKIEQACADKIFLDRAGVNCKIRAREFDYRKHAPALSWLLTEFYNGA